jgi:hypothetical protein
MRYACFGLGFQPMNFVTSPVTNLRYMLEKSQGALVFQVLEQSADIKAFLNKYNFMASNGIRIGSDKYPEFKQSKNAIFLRGSMASEDFKLDTTRFVSNSIRDNAAAALNQALRELVDVVKGVKVASPFGSYGYPVFKTGNKLNTNKVNVVYIQ